MAPTRHESPWHTLTVQWDGEELDYDSEHPDECKPQRLEDVCWFDGEFFEFEERPTEPGVYRARVWIEKAWEHGDWISGNEWEPLPAGDAA